MMMLPNSLPSIFMPWPIVVPYHPEILNSSNIIQLRSDFYYPWRVANLKAGYYIELCPPFGDPARSTEKFA